MDINKLMMNAEERRKRLCCVCGKEKIRYKFGGHTIFECNFCSKSCIGTHCIKLHKIEEVK